MQIRTPKAAHPALQMTISIFLRALTNDYTDVYGKFGLFNRTGHAESRNRRLHFSFTVNWGPVNVHMLITCNSVNS